MVYLKVRPAHLYVDNIWITEPTFFSVWATNKLNLILYIHHMYLWGTSWLSAEDVSKFIAYIFHMCSYPGGAHNSLVMLGAVYGS